jgi:hypothetical protein
MIILVIILVGSERNPEITGNSLKLLYKSMPLEGKRYCLLTCRG